MITKIEENEGECTGGQEHCAFKHPAIIQTDRNQRWNHKEYVNYTSFLTPVCKVAIKNIE